VSKACKIKIFTANKPTDFVGPLNDHYLRMADGTDVQPAGSVGDHEHHEGFVGPDEVTSKAFGILSIFLSALGGVFLRLKCPALKNSPRSFGYINVLAGSMFIGMALFHILPESIHHAPPAMQTLLTSDPTPMGVMFFVFLGFALILVSERVFFDAHGCCHNHAQMVSFDVSARGVQLGEGPYRSGSFGTFTLPICKPCEGNCTLFDTACMPLPLEVTKLQEPRRSSGDREAPRSNAVQGSAGGASESSRSAVVLLVLAISVHSVFEGIIIGTADSPATVWLLVAIVVAHEWAAAFAITNQLIVRQVQGWVMWLLVVLFCLASPIGAMLGWLIEEMADEGRSPVAKLAESILNSLAVGTLLYIGMVEVVPEEFSGARNPISKFVTFMCAALFVFAFNLLHLQYAHSHGEVQGHRHGVHDHHHQMMI